MIPILTAEESLRAAERLAVGTGATSREDRQRVVDGWLRDARQGQPRPRAQRLAPEMLGQLGIGLEVVGVPRA